MTEAQEIIARLETERHRLMLKHAQLVRKRRGSPMPF
jgi:hypothetical protein